MTTAPIERTVLPGPGGERVVELLAALETVQRPELVTADGVVIELPDELFDVLHDVVAALSRGLAITIAPRHTVLGTGHEALVPAMATARSDLVAVRRALEIISGSRATSPPP